MTHEPENPSPTPEEIARRVEVEVEVASRPALTKEQRMRGHREAILLSRRELFGFLWDAAEIKGVTGPARGELFKRWGCAPDFSDYANPDERKARIREHWALVERIEAEAVKKQGAFLQRGLSWASAILGRKVKSEDELTPADMEALLAGMERTCDEIARRIEAKSATWSKHEKDWGELISRMFRATVENHREYFDATFPAIVPFYARDADWALHTEKLLHDRAAGKGQPDALERAVANVRVPANMLEALQRTAPILSRQLSLFPADVGRREIAELVPEYTGFNLTAKGLTAFCALAEALDSGENMNPARDDHPNVLVLRVKAPLLRAAGIAGERAEHLEAGINELEQAREWVTRRPLTTPDGKPQRKHGANVYEWVKSKAPLLRAYTITRATRHEWERFLKTGDDTRAEWDGCYVYQFEPMLFDSVTRFYTKIPRGLPRLVRDWVRTSGAGERSTRHRLWGCIWTCQQATALARSRTPAAKREYRFTRDYNEVAQELHVWSKSKAKAHRGRVLQATREALDTAKGVGLLADYRIDGVGRVEIALNPEAFPHLDTPRRTPPKGAGTGRGTP